MKKIKHKIKQFLCPLKPTLYLCGGMEFGHSWRRIDGELYMFCKKCLKKKSLISYSCNSDEAKTYLYKLH